MDVTCERCSTAYEFDDALVSERGTTVKCTNCGHQFKVRRSQAAGAPERWLVRTIDGRELEFRALRELQAAIAQALITRDDVLSRGGGRPRRLGSIAELEPFFASAGGGSQHSTNLGLGPKAPPRSRGAAPAAGMPVAAPEASRSEMSVAIPLPGRGRDPGSVDDETVVMTHGSSRPQAARPSAPSAPGRLPPPAAPPRSSPPVDPRAAGLPGVIVGPAGAPPPPVVIHEESTVDGSYDADTVAESYEETTRSLEAEARAAAAELAREAAAVPRRDDVSAPTAPFPVGAVIDPEKLRGQSLEEMIAPAPAAEPGTVSAPSAEERAGGDAPASLATPTPAPSRMSYAGSDDGYGEPRFSSVGTPRRAGGARWIVGLLLAGLVVLAFATVGRRMLTSEPAAKGGQADARVAVLLAGGEKSLADGDLELAKEQFDKASVLAERDARVVADLARLAAARADIEWLKVRLLAADDPDQPVARRDLDKAVQRARRAADRAGEIAPADASVTRARIDALRLAGDLDGARKLVAAVAGQSAQPENALVLAELDLAEARPDWATIIGRLRTAVGGDGNLGRARGLLVYALARSGDLSAARAELERLKSSARPHPLLGALTGYVTRADKTVDVSALPDAPKKGAASAAPAAGARDTAPPRDLKPSPATAEPRAPSPAPSPEPPAPLPPSGPIDTSDLPGVKAPPAEKPAPAPAPDKPADKPPADKPAPAPPPANTVPPGVDTSDLPGFK